MVLKRSIFQAYPVVLLFLQILPPLAGQAMTKICDLAAIRHCLRGLECHTKK